MRRGQRGWKTDSEGLPAVKAYFVTYVEPPAAPPDSYNDPYGPRPPTKKGGRSPRTHAREERPPGEAYFLPIGTVAVPAGETHPAEEISVTDRATDPLRPAVNVTPLVPCPEVIDPLEMLQV
jgi:hypothetical protein